MKDLVRTVSKFKHEITEGWYSIQDMNGGYVWMWLTPTF